jgi:hypothetical protein
MPPRTTLRRARRTWGSHAFRPAPAKPLLRAVDNGPAVRLNLLDFAPPELERSQGAFVDVCILDLPLVVGGGQAFAA